MHLGRPRGSEGLDPPGAEELEDAELADVPPVGAVGREGDVGAAVEEVPRRVRLRAAAEGEVVRAEHLAGGARRGDDDGGDGAEGEPEDGAVGERQAAEGEVRPAAQLVEVADHRQRRRARREVQAVSV